MIDRENVIKAYKCCKNSFDRICEKCPYEKDCCHDGIPMFVIKKMVDLLKEQEDLGTELTNAVELIHKKNERIEKLLKEQKAVVPKVEKAILDYQSWHYICGDCGGQIDIHDNYCRHCGRVVAHISNKI